MTTKFETELRELLNRNCVENASDTPDFILAKFLVESLTAFNAAVGERSRWYKHEPWAKRKESSDE